MDELDKENTYVLLIGSSTYPNWQVMNIPNVKVNIEELKSLLSDPFYCGIPSNKISVVVDESLEDTNLAIQEFFDNIQAPKATVILYYAGHGLQSVKAIDDLFLATRNIREKAFEASSIRISELRTMFAECVANKKILLLDCCYAGKITRGFMSDDTSETIAKLNQFEGTYIMAASSEYERARFDPDDPNSPTKFTGKFVDIVKNGIDADDEYCTLNSIYWQIQRSFSSQTDAPKPIQVSKENIGAFPLFRNKKFGERIPKDEQEWKKVLIINTVYAYNAFIDEYPESKYVDEAKKKIEDMEDEAAWKKASNRNTIGGYRAYLSYYRNHLQEANQKLNELVDIEKEDEMWQSAVSENKIELFNQYLEAYPTGKFAEEARRKIEKSQVGYQKKRADESKHQILLEAKKGEGSTSGLKIKLLKIILGGAFFVAVVMIPWLIFNGENQEEKSWRVALNENDSSSYAMYLANFEKGKHAKIAKQKLDSIINENKAISDSIANKNQINNDNEFWRAAGDINKISSYTSYKEHFPFGIHYHEAQARIDSLKQISDFKGNDSTGKQKTISFKKTVPKNNIPLIHDLKSYIISFKFRVSDSKPIEWCDLYIDDKYIKSLYFISDGTGAVENDIQVPGGGHKIVIKNIKPLYDDVSNDVWEPYFIDIRENTHLLLSWYRLKPPGWNWIPRIVRISSE